MYLFRSTGKYLHVVQNKFNDGLRVFFFTIFVKNNYELSLNIPLIFFQYLDRLCQNIHNM